MLNSLYTGVSGINAHMNQMSVVGNNISNMNTYGFKASRCYFADVIKQSLSGVSGSNQASGLGVMVASIMPNFSQGAFEQTDNPLDLAVDGSGFFVLKSDAGGTFYTRAGNFILDKEGTLVNRSGLFLQGYQADGDGKITNNFGNLQFASTVYPPQSTSNVTIRANLQSDAQPPAAFDEMNAEATSNFATSLTVFDSLGNTHPVSLYFRMNDLDPNGNEWEWFAVVDPTHAASGAPEIGARGTLEFNPSGRLTSVVVDFDDRFSFSGGPAQDQQIAFDFGEDLNGVSQFGSTSSVSSLSRDGFGAGSLQGVNIDESGVITGRFTNGKLLSLGQVALATFPNPSGVQEAGKMLYVESLNSGEVVYGQPRTESLGSVRANTLELSNVDLGSEFVRMITAQRGFQANSKVITSTDEILHELVNLKR